MVHAGIIGNEGADAIAKLSAQCDTGHGTFFLVGGNLYKHVHWLADAAQPPLPHNTPAMGREAAAQSPTTAEAAAKEALETPTHLTHISNLENQIPCKDHK